MVRILISVWLLFAFLVTAGYGGQLRSFLLNPGMLKIKEYQCCMTMNVCPFLEFEDSIDTLEKVLSSGIPWEIGLYGEDVEVQMARSEHPTMKAIWDGKIPVINEAFAFQRVSKHFDR